MDRRMEDGEESKRKSKEYETKDCKIQFVQFKSRRNDES